MTLGQLEIFTRFLKEGSVTATAVKLGITPSAVSHALAALEKDLNVQLLDREHSPSVPTKIGRHVANLANEVVGLTNRIRQESQKVKGDMQGVLHIGSCGSSASIQLLPPIIREFKACYPHVMIKLIEAPDIEVTSLLIERHVDVACLVLPDQRFDTMLLAEDRLVVVLAKNHHLLDREALTLADLAQEVLLLTDAGSAPLIELAYRQAGITMHSEHRFSQILSMLDWAARGEGIVLMAELAVPKGVYDVAMRPLMPMCQRLVGLAVRDIHATTPVVQAFWNIAAKQMQDRNSLQKGSGI
jgi:DNA-binding transcriptional LysR family regulator